MTEQLLPFLWRAALLVLHLKLFQHICAFSASLDCLDTHKASGRTKLVSVLPSPQTCPMHRDSYGLVTALSGVCSPVQMDGCSSSPGAAVRHRASPQAPAHCS